VFIVSVDSDVEILYCEGFLHSAYLLVTILSSLDMKPQP